MPVISEFYGIIIRINFADHNPPHFHAKYGSYSAYFDLKGNKIKGRFPDKQEKIVAAWAVLHEKELKDNWERAKKNKPCKNIKPLK